VPGVPPPGSAALFALAAKFAWSDAFGQAREIGWLLVFDGSGSHFVKATVMSGPD
jgi:hypothetical protein